MVDLLPVAQYSFLDENLWAIVPSVPRSKCPTKILHRFPFEWPMGDDTRDTASSAWNPQKMSSRDPVSLLLPLPLSRSLYLSWSADTRSYHLRLVWHLFVPFHVSVYLERNRYAPNIAPLKHIGKRNCNASIHLTDTSPSIVVGIISTAWKISCVSRYRCITYANSVSSTNLTKGLESGDTFCKKGTSLASNRIGLDRIGLL